LKKIYYSYSKNDLLQNPEKYENTPYSGITFLDSYVEFRKNILKLSTIDIKIDEFLSSVILKNNIETFENIHKDFSTLDMFSKLLKQILTGNINSNVISTVSIFLKKFEITKKISSRHDKNFKGINNDFSNIQNYIVFAIICNILYEKTSDLKFLNVVLKLNDLICSQIKKLSKSEQSLSKISIEYELNNIKKLSKEKGVDFHWN
jgi:hypothetical protein